MFLLAVLIQMTLVMSQSLSEISPNDFFYLYQPNLSYDTIKKILSYKRKLSYTMKTKPYVQINGLMIR